MVGRVKELVVGVSHQTAPCSRSQGTRKEEGTGQPLSTSLLSSSPSGLILYGAKRWRDHRKNCEERGRRSERMEDE